MSHSGKQSSDISAVVNPVSGVVKFDIDEIKLEVEKYIVSVFQGSYETIPAECGAASDHNYSLMTLL